MDEYVQDREQRRTRSPAPAGDENKKRDCMTRVVAVQSLVCALLVLTSYSIKKSGGEVYEQLRAEYISIAGQNVGAKGIFSDAKDIFSFLFVPAKQESGADTDTAVSETSTDLFESSDEGEESTVAVIAEPEQIVTVTSSGGEDIQVLEGLSSSSFAPVKLSVDAVLPVEGEITSKFGYRIHPITGNESFHTGVDIAAKSGTRIAAAFDGTVTQTGETNMRGKYMLISHGGNVETLYCHCDKLIAKQGDVIRAGETVALVGSTGWSTGPHLHFELHIDSVRCNPEWIFPKELES